MQAFAPAGVGLRRHGFADHVEAKQQTDCLHGDKWGQNRLLQLVHRLFKRGDGGVVPAGRGSDLRYQVLWCENRRTQMCFTALAQFHEADGYPEKPCNSKGLVVADIFQMAADALRSGVDTEQGLGKRTLLPNR